MASAGLLALGLAAIGPVSAHTARLTNATASTGAAYTAINPVRLLDTRATGQTLGPNSTLNLNVETAADGVPSNATAVALNVTTAATDGGVVTSPGYVSVYPTGGTQPLVSNLNFTAGETVPNSVIVPVGTGGSVTFYNHTGNTDLVVDIEGYFAPESGGSTAGAYVPLTPARITDTRTGSGFPNAGKTMGPNSTLNIQVTGAGGVPAGASGAILNVTVTNTTDSGYLEAYPQGATQPTASNLNWSMGETVANRVLVSLSASGMITLYNHTGNTDVIVDVSGYFTNGTATLPSNASLYSPITPTRLVDTRVSGGTLSAGGIDTEQIAGMGGIPSTATAGVLNVTAVNTTAASFFTVYPSTSSQPTASDVNWLAGQIVPNLTVATLGTTGAVDVYNHAGSADLVIDAFGYFSKFVAPIISVSASPASISVGTVNNTSTITATVTDSSLTYPDPVQFTTNGATACGTLSPASGSVSASGGTATTTYTAGSTTGTCVITATEASGGNSATTTVTQTAAVNSVSLTGSSSVATGGQDTLTATVTPPTGGTTAQSDKVTFTSSGTCGTLNPTQATTSATGSGAESVTTIYTASGVPGFCTVTATEANTGQTGTFTIDQTSLTANTVTVKLTPATYPTTGTVTANGTNSYTITVATTVGGTSVAYPNDQVQLTLTPGTGDPASDCGTLSSSSVTTNSSGTATVTYTTPAEAIGTTSPNTCVISGQEAASGDSSGVNSSTVNQTAPTAAANTITASPAAFTTTSGSGNQTAITVAVSNSSGAVSGDTIDYTISAGNVCGTISPSSGAASTGSAGTVIFTYTAAAFNGFCDITFEEHNTSATTTVYITNNGGSAGPAPTVTSLVPATGPTTGTTSVAISGTNFESSTSPATAIATAVDFGTTPATSFVVNSANSITAIAPAGTGAVNVTVTTPYGTSTNTATYTYTPVMVSAIVTSGTGTAANIVVTYSEPVSCASGAGGDFTYANGTGTATTAFNCAATSSTTLTLTGTGSNVYVAVSSGATLTYAPPSTNSATASVYAAGPIYEVGQTLTSTGTSSGPLT